MRTLPGWQGFLQTEVGAAGPDRLECCQTGESTSIDRKRCHLTAGNTVLEGQECRLKGGKIGKDRVATKGDSFQFTEHGELTLAHFEKIGS